MDRLFAMEVFTKVARSGGFAAAARSMRLSTTAVSRHVGQLEAHLGVRLLQRTTRKVSLTEPGVAYLQRCEQLLEEVQELEDALLADHREPRGRLRISAGVSFAQEQLNAWMPSFMRRCPKVQVEVLLTDEHLDLIRNQLDVAVRIGRLKDSSMFARRIASIHHVVCVSKEYLEKNGPLESPEAILSRECVIDTNQKVPWRFQGPGEDPQVQNIAAQGRYQVNSAHAARDAAAAGLGPAYLPTFVAGPWVREGRLVLQLSEYRGSEIALYAVYPENRYLSAAVRAFIDALVEAYSGEPEWDRGLFPRT